MTSKGYRLIDHTADLGIEVEGPDMAALFEQAAWALFDVLVQYKPGAAASVRVLQIEGQDRTDLMINWLRELLYLFSGEELVLSAVEIESISDTSLRARMCVEPFSAGRHRVRHEIKAVTYHQAAVDPANDAWRARVIFDI